jgi:tetratricopeptide (TPR) repeat protein
MRRIICLLAFAISISSFGQSTEEYLSRGIDKAKKQEYDQAINDFDKSIQLYSDNTDSYFKADAYYNRGTVKMILGDYYGAIADLTKAIGLDSKYARIYYQRALCKQVLENYKGALDDYTKTIELNTNSSQNETEVVVGSSINVDDKPKRFTLDDLSLVDISLAAYSNRGTIRQIFEDFSGAISDFNKAIQLNPNDAEIYYNVAISYESYKNYNKAIDNYTKAIKLNSNYTNAYVNRSILREKLGDFLGACSDAKIAAKFGHTQSKNWAENSCY